VKSSGGSVEDPLSRSLVHEPAELRRRLPWVRVDKDYRFHGPGGPRSLPELFDGRSQLLVYHFMFGPDWDEGCPSCSFWADSFDGVAVHLAHRDVTLIAVSRAALDKLAAYRKRMGWTFPWFSSAGSDFNFDFGVSFTAEQQRHGGDYNFTHQEHPPEEAPGVSVFATEDTGDVFHTYSSYARGLDPIADGVDFAGRVPRRVGDERVGVTVGTATFEPAPQVSDHPTATVTSQGPPCPSSPVDWQAPNCR
jgi:predicted dithiol-disulfide oxidoreductase (DUF899 family)